MQLWITAKLARNIWQSNQKKLLQIFKQSQYGCYSSTAALSITSAWWVYNFELFFKENLILEQYLLHPELLPIHDTGPAQQHWRRTISASSIVQSQSCPSQHVIRVVRDPCTGHVTDFLEQRLEPGSTGTHAKNSSSMQRSLAPPDSSFRGSASNYPFWPGGFDLPQVEVDEDSEELDFSPSKLLHCPPGKNFFNHLLF